VTVTGPVVSAWKTTRTIGALAVTSAAIVVIPIAVAPRVGVVILTLTGAEALSPAGAASVAGAQRAPIASMQSVARRIIVAPRPW
jgi:hypothetical protein